MNKDKKMSNHEDKVLLTWLARNNDPYERNRDDSYRIDSSGQKIWGPTLTVLFDPTSCYCRQIKDVVLFFRIPPPGSQDNPETERLIAQETIEEIKKIADSYKLGIHPIKWNGNDPTDHMSIFEFMKEQIPLIRKEFADREIIIHISPGTPSMHTIWMLMAETGFIEPPFTVVKSYRLTERQNRQTVVPVRIGIETFYKVYQKSHPSSISPEEQQLFWDPSLFRSSRLKKLYMEARRFARLKIPVLLLGERGTGKTMLASWIRSYSPYRQKELDDNWPSVACGQYTQEVMRAELFGYKKGAFTDAKEDHDGLIKIANGDTLFLDEIGDISRELQRLLIRVLEEKTFLPLGSTTQEKSDFRLITATNRTWKELQTRLDSDFWDRISILRLRLPALREIREDIPWLWEKVWQSAKEKAGIQISRMLSEKIEHSLIVNLLQNHPLPGNLRDLFQIAYRLIAALGEEECPMNIPDAVQYAMEAFETPPEESQYSEILERVASAIAHRQPLDFLFTLRIKFPTKALEREFKNYLAGEIRRISRIRQISIEELCDVTERTILNWSK